MSGAQKSVEDLKQAVMDAINRIEPIYCKGRWTVVGKRDAWEACDTLAAAAEEAQRGYHYQNICRSGHQQISFITLSDGFDPCPLCAAEKSLEAERVRVANEIAARQRAQEHGIGDRARIEELERERDEAREHVKVLEESIQPIETVDGHMHYTTEGFCPLCDEVPR